MQLTWIAKLGDETDISPEVVQKGVVGVTRGQATLLIGEMKKHKQRLDAANGGMVMFGRAIEYARTELPILEEEATLATKQEADVKLENAAAFPKFPESVSAAIVKSES